MPTIGRVTTVVTPMATISIHPISVPSTQYPSNRLFSAAITLVPIYPPTLPSICAERMIRMHSDRYTLHRVILSSFALYLEHRGWILRVLRLFYGYCAHCGLIEGNYIRIDGYIEEPDSFLFFMYHQAPPAAPAITSKRRVHTHQDFPKENEQP